MRMNLFGITLALLIGPACAFGQTYMVNDLGLNQFTPDLEGVGLSNQGRMVGYDGGGNADPLVMIDGNITMLTALHNNYQAKANAINSSGLIAGYSCGFNGCNAVTWDGAAAPMEIAPNFYPLAMNDAGEIVGRTLSPINDASAAAIWLGGSLKKLSRFPAPAAAQIQSHANAVNNNGQVVGEADVYDDANDHVAHAVLWNGSEAQDLGADARADGINDHGQVVGEFGGNAALWSNGALSTLSGLGGSSSEAYAINNEGVIVGLARGEPNDRPYAVVWINGVIYKLDDVVEPHGALNGFTSENAVAINASGQILIVGANGISNDALILTPPGVAQTVSAPRVSLISRTYASPQTVTLTDATPAAKIYYTLDGTNPTSQSALYQAPVTISQSTTLKAIAIVAGFTDSKVVSATYTIAAPTIPSTPINLSSVVNVQAIGQGAQEFYSLDSLGNSYAPTLVGASVYWSGVAFDFLAPSGLNGATGVKIALPSGRFSNIKLLGTATRGNRSHETFVVTYADGSSVRFIQGMSDWATPQSYPGESLALTTDYRLGEFGVQSEGPYELYGYTFALDPTKAVQSLTLPASRYVTVVAGALLGAVADDSTCARISMNTGCDARSIQSMPISVHD